METGLGIEDKLIESKEVNPNGGLDQNFRELSAGAGSSVFKVNADGVFIGAETYASAPFKVNYAGNFTVGSGSNSVTWNGSTLAVRGSLNADDITAGTLVGRTVKAKGTGSASDVWLDGSVGEVSFYYNGTKIADLYSDTSGRVLLTSSSQSVYITAGTDFYCSGADWFAVSNSDLTSVFNDDGGGDSARWVNDSSLTMEHRDNGDLAISGSYL